MKRSRLFASVAILAGLGLLGTAVAQSTEDHAAHHPGQNAGAPGPQAAAADGRGCPSAMPEVNAMPSSAPMRMPMAAGDIQPMSRVMAMVRERMAHGVVGHVMMDGLMGAMPFEHVEGRIAFLKAEIGITDAQQPQWTAFANALRTQAAAMRTVHERMLQGEIVSDWSDRLSMEEGVLASSLDAVRSIQGPAQALYATLSAEQKAEADELLGRPMAMPGRM